MIKRILKYIVYKLRFGDRCTFSANSYISKRSTFEGMNKVHPNASFDGEMGYGSYIGGGSNVSGKVGRFTSIGRLISVIQGTHPYTAPFASTAPCFYALNKDKQQNGDTFATEQLYDELMYADQEKKYPVIIGNDCWLGTGASIVAGITIHDGAVILAHAVVTKDVPPYAVVGGIPARVIKYRYDQDTIDFLLKTQWWNNSEQWFRINWKLLSDITKLKEYYANIHKRH